MNVPVLTKLQSKLSDLKKRLKLPDVCAEPRRKTAKLTNYTDEATTLSEVIDCIDRWINSMGSVQPSWRNFFRILKDISPKLDILAYQIKELFHGKINNN